MSENNQPGTQSTFEFRIGRIYAPSIHIESDVLPQAFENESKSKLDISIEVHHKVLNKDIYDVRLRIQIASKTEDGKDTLFKIDLTQAAIFIVREFPGSMEDFERFLYVYCASQVFPYMRENIDNLVVRLGFMPILISNIDFETLYKERYAGVLKKESMASSGNSENKLSQSERDELARLRGELSEIKQMINNKQSAEAPQADSNKLNQALEKAKEAKKKKTIRKTIK